MTYGIKSGITKPKNYEFLRETVDELKHLLKNGIFIKIKHIEIKLSCITCDAPARAFIKSCTGHACYY